LAERLRAAIASTPAQTDEGAITVRVSIGLSEVDGCAAKLALRRADEALYIAKGSGRDRVKVWAG
jgi:diguanylate cyclase (GGDEF)-like protein